MLKTRTERLNLLPHPGRKQKCGQSKRRRWQPASPTRWRPPCRVCRFCVLALNESPSIPPSSPSPCVCARAGRSACVHVYVHARAHDLLLPVSASRALAPSLSISLSLHLSLPPCLQHLLPQSPAYPHLSPPNSLSLSLGPAPPSPFHLSSIARFLAGALARCSCWRRRIT